MLILFFFVNLRGPKSLNPVSYSHLTPFNIFIFISLKSINASDVFLKLTLGKYNCREYTTIKVDVQFVSNLNNIQGRIEPSQLNLFS